LRRNAVFPQSRMPSSVHVEHGDSQFSVCAKAVCVFSTMSCVRMCGECTKRAWRKTSSSHVAARHRQKPFEAARHNGGGKENDTITN
jgi:hypothetical protein